jgi:hypothetical protein
MIKYISDTIILFIPLLINACASSERTNIVLLLEVEKIENSTCLNLMQGLSQGKFHLKGKMTSQNQIDEEIKNINLDNITVYSSEVDLNSFKPYFTNITEEDNFNLKAGIAECLNIDEIIVNNKLVNIRLNSVSDDGNYYYSVDRVAVEEAY